MKKYGQLLLYISLLLSGFLLPATFVAQNDSACRMFRAYEDDDYFNDLGQGTDRAYTSGSQLTMFYNSKKHRFFLNRLLPKAGDSSINTYGIGEMQIMYTPQYLNPAYYYPNDYSYAGGLVAKYLCYSFNPVKNYDVQTEIAAGVIGPAALCGPIQRWVHSALSDTGHANGWGNQYRNDLLLNFNFCAEKNLYTNQKYFELIGYARLYAGTMFDAIETGPIMRIGKMASYFEGFLSHYSTSYKKAEVGFKKIQAYFTVNAGIQLVLYNAMLQGGLFTPSPNVFTYINVGSKNEGVYIPEPRQHIENMVGFIAYGPVLAYRHWSASFTQTYYTRQLKNVYADFYGNVTVYYNW